MAWEMDMPDEMGGGGNFLSEAGTYHCAIVSVTEGAGPKGGIIDGFTVGLDALAGTTPGQEHKVFNLTLFNPKLDQSDAGKRMARLKQAAFVIAANVATPAQLGQRVQVDLQKAVGQQIVLKLVKDEGKDYPDLNYADIWHVDDPRCKDVPKNQQAISMIPQGLRHDATWFEQLKPRKTAAGGNGSGQPKQQASQPAKPATISYDDL